MRYSISDEEPKATHSDCVINGKARIICRWDAQQIEYTDEMTGSMRIKYEYKEQVILWALPVKYTTPEEVQQYCDSIESEILGYAKGTELNLGAKS
jgi:hypothetical protein